MSTNSLQGYNLDNFEANFREFLITEKVSPTTLKNYLSDLRHFLGWYALYQASQASRTVIGQDNSPAAAIERMDDKATQAYRDYLASNRLPESTINRRLSTLRKFCSFCISQGWLKQNPAKNIANITARPRHHTSAVMTVEIAPEDLKSPEEEVVFSAKQLFEFQKSLGHESPREAQTVAKDIEEFFIIINSTNTI